MSAREKLFETMAGGWSLTQAEAAPLYQAIDGALGLHAHELAEQQRAYAREVGVPLEDGGIVSAGDLVDLIDPYERPVGSEEPTT